MSTLYETLGLSQGADREQIKAAFRKLARCFHPDVNASDVAAEKRFKEISAAYRTLIDPDARAAYDRALLRRRDLNKRRLWQLAPIAIAAGTLTVSLAFFVLIWAQSSPSPQQDNYGAQHEADASEQVPGRRASWTSYSNSRFLFTLSYPADVFSITESADDNGAVLVSTDGRARLRIFAAKNVTGKTLSEYRRFLLQNRYEDVSIDYAPRSKLWFVLSGTQGEEVVYEHVGFSCDGASLHGWQMTYPAHERTFFDLVADEVHRSTFLTSLHCGAVPPLPHSKPPMMGAPPDPPRLKPQLASSH